MESREKGGEGGLSFERLVLLYIEPEHNVKKKQKNILKSVN